MSEKFKLPVVSIRLVEENPIMGEEPLNSPQAVVSRMKKEISFLDREVMVVIFFSTKMKPLGVHYVSIGSIDHASVSPREVMKAGILLNAASFVMMHNHPSGDVTPSQSDILITQKMSCIGRLMGMELTDHIIVAPYTDEFYSFLEYQPSDLSPGNIDKFIGVLTTET